MDDATHDRLSRLWDEHRSALFPPTDRGRELTGVDLVLLDANIAGCASSALTGTLDARRRECLEFGIGQLAVVLPLITEEQIGGKRFAPHPTTVMSATRGAEAHLGVVAGAGLGRTPARGGGDSRHGVRVRDSRESGPTEISLAEGEAPRAAEWVNEYQAQAADRGTTG